MSGNYNVSIWDAVFIYWAPQSFNINEIDMKDLEIMSLSDDFYGKTGTPASFHIEVEGSGNISYQWQYRTVGTTGWKTPSQGSRPTITLRSAASSRMIPGMRSFQKSEKQMYLHSHHSLLMQPLQKEKW